MKAFYKYHLLSSKQIANLGRVSFIGIARRPSDEACGVATFDVALYGKNIRVEVNFDFVNARSMSEAEMTEKIIASKGERLPSANLYFNALYDAHMNK